MPVPSAPPLGEGSEDAGPPPRHDHDAAYKAALTKFDPAKGGGATKDGSEETQDENEGSLPPASLLASSTQDTQGGDIRFVAPSFSVSDTADTGNDSDSLL